MKELLSQARKAYPAATHYCYAWRLGAEGLRTRSSDDGEPSGTAGKPILGQIEREGITNVMCVVVRYFGGSLLGTGGLVNAYRSAAAGALLAAGTREVFVQRTFTLECDEADIGAVMRTLRQIEAEILATGYHARHTLRFRIRSSREKAMREKLKELFRVILQPADPPPE